MSVFTYLIALFGCADGKSGITSCSSAEFEELLQGDPAVQLVDVRRLDEYNAGHIGNAILIDVTRSDFVAKAVSSLDKAKPVAVYCRSGVRSMKAAKLLEKEGFKVYNLKKGYEGWAVYQKSK